MERRVLLAVLLSFVVLYGYQLLFPPPPEPKPAATGQPGATNPSAGGAQQPTPALPPEALSRQVPPATAADTADGHARGILGEDPAIPAAISTRGAAPEWWRPNKH